MEIFMSVFFIFLLDSEYYDLKQNISYDLKDVKKHNIFSSILWKITISLQYSYVTLLWCHFNMNSCSYEQN